MKSFITGVTGFAGSYLAEHLLAAGDEVWGCSRSARCFSAVKGSTGVGVGVWAAATIPSAVVKKMAVINFLI